MTDPDGTVVLDAVVTVPTVSPAFAIAVDAAACVRPTTFGTTAGGPDETTRSTAETAATSVPPEGLWLMTDPADIVVLDAVLTVPTVRPAAPIAAAAPACARPTTLGTMLTTSIVTLAVAIVNFVVSAGVNVIDSVCASPLGKTVPAGGV